MRCAALALLEASGSTPMLAHIAWNCARNTGSPRIAFLCLCANSSRLALNTTIWSFIACRLDFRTSSPVSLNCSCRPEQHQRGPKERACCWSWGPVLFEGGLWCVAGGMEAMKVMLTGRTAATTHPCPGSLLQAGDARAPPHPPVPRGACCWAWTLEEDRTQRWHLLDAANERIRCIALKRGAGGEDARNAAERRWISRAVLRQCGLHPSPLCEAGCCGTSCPHALLLC